MKRTKLAIIAVTLGILTLSGCTAAQWAAWLDAHGADSTQLTAEELDAGAAFATAWWEAQATTTTTKPAPPPRPQLPAYLICVRHRESRGDYTAYNASSGASGAFQFLRQTWDNTARHAGRWDLVGVDVRWVSPADQDAMAIHLLNWYGPSPWAGPGC